MGKIEDLAQRFHVASSRSDSTVVEISKDDGVPCLHVEIALQVTEISKHLGLNEPFWGGRSKIVLMPPNT